MSNYRGDLKSPLFILKMTLKERVEQLLQKVLAERTDLFLIALKVSSNGEIKVIVDGDQGVTLNDCIDISRGIEHPLNEDEFDFSLEVMSPGASEPIINNRQYRKNIGRTLLVRTAGEDVYEAVLTEVDDNGIHLSWKERQPKPVGKGKRTVKLEKMISFSEVSEAKVKIKFN